MLIFRCDICKELEDYHAATFKLPDRDDLCKSCLTSLQECADLLTKDGFKQQLSVTHEQFFPDGKLTKES